MPDTKHPSPIEARSAEFLPQVPTERLWALLLMFEDMTAHPV